MPTATYVQASDGFIYQLNIIDNGNGTFSTTYTRIDVTATTPSNTSGGFIVANLLVEAMALIGATAMDETPTISEMNTCLISLNLMLDSFSAQNLMIRATTRETFPLVGSQHSYSIGTGATFNTSKPIKVETAYLSDTTGYDTPLNVVEKDLYDSYSDKIISQGRPEVICYDPGATQQNTQAGTIFVYPVPDTSIGYSITLESQKYLTEFAALTDVVTFEPAYYEMIVYNLAVRIWRKFHQGDGNVPADIIAIANSSKRTVQNMNARTPTVGMDLPGMRRGTNYNIYTDNN